MWHFEESATCQQPERFQETATVPPESALSFWASMDELKPEAIRPRDSGGVDGMSVEAFFRHGDSLASFETWHPDPASPDGRFLHSIYDLAWKVLEEPISIDRLEQLFGYVHEERLPARLVSGDVTCIRIFGFLSSQHERGLRQLFDSLPKATPIIVDISNFDNGTKRKTAK